ncbi:glycosyltransferase [Candidatus Methylocalor cossyra]|uniref:Glycosyl transferase family 2 n=1 Tax=Candidatus Methylocalor cossyra TaxID=3108543 RepID=A0ABP1CAV5_9GAMM
MTMTVSVVLTVLNEAKNLAALLDDLLAQSLPPDEIVIVDGGSTDGTRALLQRYADRHPSIKVFVEPGVNIARGRNLAIARATGEIIAVTDGGCRPDPDWLRELIAPFQRDPEVDAVAGRICAIGTTRFDYYNGLLSIPEGAGTSQTRMFYGRSSAFRRALWARIGGYPEWLYTAEDSLFALRAQGLGAKIVSAPASRLLWYPRPTLFKTAKMFYLYGRGNGHIQRGDLKGTLYWLRYHALWLATLAAGFWQPWLWLGTAATLAQLLRISVGPALRQLEAAGVQAPDRFFYVPLIVLTRNLATNLGYLAGHLEYRRNATFRERLRAYRELP